MTFVESCPFGETWILGFCEKEVGVYGQVHTSWLFLYGGLVHGTSTFVKTGVLDSLRERDGSL